MVFTSYLAVVSTPLILSFYKSLYLNISDKDLRLQLVKKMSCVDDSMAVVACSS